MNLRFERTVRHGVFLSFCVFALVINIAKHAALRS
jgi:hypothetical protein